MLVESIFLLLKVVDIVWLSFVNFSTGAIVIELMFKTNKQIIAMYVLISVSSKIDLKA